MMKKIIALSALLVAVSLLNSGCGSLAKILGIAVVASELDKSQNEQKEQKKKNEPLFSYDNYQEVSVSTLMNALEQNAAKASSITKGKNFKIIDGKIGIIDSDGDQFNLEHDNFTISTITCYVKDKSVAQEQLLEVKRGQQVDVYGKITRVGEMLGYSVDVDRIELPGQHADTSAQNNPINSPTATPVTKVRDETEEVSETVNAFMHAYFKRDRNTMKDYSIFQGRIYNNVNVYDLFDEQVGILSSALSIYKQQTGIAVTVKWNVSNIKKVNSNQYQVSINIELSPDRITYSPVLVEKVDGIWFVDAESFATASHLALNPSF